MEAEKLVTNLELSKKLDALGIEQNSFFYWSKLKDDFSLFFCEEKIFDVPVEHYSAYTAEELFEMLPGSFNYNDTCYNVKIFKHNNFFSMVYYNVLHMEYGDYHLSVNGEKAHAVDKTLADCAAKMLIFLIENGLFKTQ